MEFHTISADFLLSNPCSRLQPEREIYSHVRKIQAEILPFSLTCQGQVDHYAQVGGETLFYAINANYLLIQSVLLKATRT